MPRSARRIVWAGKPHLAAFRARTAAFLEPADFQFYLSLVRNAAGPAGIRILAHALLPDRVFLAVAPEREDSLSDLGRRVNAYYASYLNARLGASGSVWQPMRQWCPASDAERGRLIRFVESAPVEAGLTWHAELYPWSSCNARAVAGPDPAAGLLRKCLDSGRPFGDEAFLRQAEEHFGRTFPRWEEDAVLLPKPGPVLVKRPGAVSDMILENQSTHHEPPKLHRRGRGGIATAGTAIPVLLPARVSAS